MAAQGWQKTVTTAFKRMDKPGEPIIVVNVWDAASVQASASVPGVRALATASYALVVTYDVPDNDLTYEQNLAAVARIAPITQRHNLPLTVDFQDGYIAHDISRSVAELVPPRRRRRQHRGPGRPHRHAALQGRRRPADQAGCRGHGQRRGAGCCDQCLNRCDWRRRYH
jgi:hypothetical protein